MSSSEFVGRIKAAAAAINFESKPTIGLILGSGMGAVLEACAIKQRIAYKGVPSLVATSAPSHKGEFVLAECGGAELIIANGRLHLYEGLSAQEVVTPVYIMQRLGVQNLVITNAAGSLNENFNVADLMLISDHINLTGLNPLIGLNDEVLGPRFPDMSQAYNQSLRDAWLKAASTAGIECQQGIYAGVTGPSLETSAERRFFRTIGADAVGMSTVLETIAANHCGVNVLGISAITNMATGGVEQQPDSIEAVLAAAKLAADKVAELLPEFCEGVS